VYDLTMIAFHGKRKPGTLRNLLSDVLGVVSANLPAGAARSFARYDFTQVHATIMGMEVDVQDGQCFGRWFRENRKKKVPIHVGRLHDTAQQMVRERGDRLFTIRFGGFREIHCTCASDHHVALGEWACASGSGTSEEFHSCDRTGYDGSFYTTTGPVMVTGWPVNGPDEVDAFPHSLHAFRQSLEHAGFSDKYHYGRDHRNAHWRDDDCFIKIGTFVSPPGEEERSAIDAAVRDYLSSRKPVTVDIAADDVAIMLYDDPSLSAGHVLDRVTLRQFLDDPRTVETMLGRVVKQRAG